MMNARLHQELESLSIAERRSLGEALVLSADSEAFAPLISPAQRNELSARLAHHRAHPNEAGLSAQALHNKLWNSRT
jgi:putative addiction module component (TIGR02574 family)